jgi:rhodanese-related sulfurtransferase
MNKKYLIVVLVLIALLIAAISICRTSEPIYKQTVQEALADLAKGEGVILPQDAVNLSQGKGDANYVFIDIRTPYDYVKGHIEGAVNLPSNSILTTEAQEVFEKLNDAKTTTILYGNSQNQANTPWLLLKQLGFDNVRILAGGYSSFYAFMGKDSLAMANFKAAEMPLLDFKAATLVDSTQLVKSQAKPKKEVKVTPVVKKQEAAEGGC